MTSLTRRLGRGARMVGAAILLVPFSFGSAHSSAGVQMPVAEIVNPENSKIFRPGDVPLVDGNAFAGLGVRAVKLEFWLLNKLDRSVLAGCSACRTATAAYWDYRADGLLPGYYVVKAYAVDNAGNFSPAAQRGFVYGLQTIQTPSPPATPQPPTPPGQLPTPTIDQPPGVLLPGASEPVTIRGTTSGSDQTVRVREQNLGPLGSTTSDDDGNWDFATRLPTGIYRFRVKAQDEDGARSAWSRIYRLSVDADRPLLGVSTPAETIFLPTDPVVIEGTLFDRQQPGRVRVEYWLTDDIVLVQNAIGTASDAGAIVWESRPTALQPGYYYVRIAAYDRAGNPSHNASTTFLYAV